LAAALISAGTAAARDDARVEGARTALFGLFHGLGFASVLGALNPAAQVPLLPLLGFNLGVEIGQLLFVLALWGLLHWWPSLRRLPLAPLVLALGSFWFVMRVA
ncbi:MAG TPA: HupE/UreJ family protein, partial [Solimonas sp.]|nr:HupE/UreJ family protein [Solimonas sp.]